MKASLVKTSIKESYLTNEPCMIWGPSGVGKSEVMAQLAAELDIGLIDLRASQMDQVDLRGVPYVHKESKRTFWARPWFLPQEGKGILFIDEINTAPPSMQAAFYQLMQDRRIGEHVLGEGWVPMAAGNREEDKGVINRMPAPLANRLTHIDFEVDLEEWVTWAIRNKIALEVISFIRFRPVLLHNFDAKVNTKAFPSPRTWVKVAKAVASPRIDEDTKHGLIKGRVGQAAATEFNAFLKMYKTIPNIDLIIMNPDDAPIPKDLSVNYALCGALAARANKQNVEAIIRYSYRLEPEFGVVLVRDAVRRDPHLSETKPFTDWCIKNSNIVL